MQYRDNAERGFTLIELLITLGILGILTVFALPSYQEYMIRGKRATALEAVLQEAAYQEREYTRNGEYAAKPNFRVADKTYRIRTIIQNGGQTYKIRAIPLNGQTNDTCGWLQLDSVGRKRAYNKSVSLKCWDGK